MTTRKPIILTTALAGLTLLAAETTQLRAEPRVARRIAATAQESQQFQGILSARIALSRQQAELAEPIRAPRAPRVLQRLRQWFAELSLPMPFLDADPDLGRLQRHRPGRRPTRIADLPLPTPLFGPVRRGRILDGRRPSEPE